MTDLEKAATAYHEASRRVRKAHHLFDLCEARLEQSKSAGDTTYLTVQNFENAKLAVEITEADLIAALQNLSTAAIAFPEVM